MRPEYLLTQAGKAIGEPCSMLTQTMAKLTLEETALKKWSMPLLFAICKGCHRFSDLRDAYPDITSKALIESLKEMALARLIHRLVLDTYPPSVEYRILPDGQRFCPGLTKLVSTLDGL